MGDLNPPLTDDTKQQMRKQGSSGRIRNAAGVWWALKEEGRLYIGPGYLALNKKTEEWRSRPQEW